MKLKITANQAAELQDAMRVQCEDKTPREPIARRVMDKLKAGTVTLDDEEIDIVRREAESRRDLWWDRKCIEGRQSAGMYRSMEKLVQNLR